MQTILKVPFAVYSVRAAGTLSPQRSPPVVTVSPPRPHAQPATTSFATACGAAGAGAATAPPPPAAGNDCCPDAAAAADVKDRRRQWQLDLAMEMIAYALDTEWGSTEEERSEHSCPWWVRQPGPGNTKLEPCGCPRKGPRCWHCTQGLTAGVAHPVATRAQCRQDTETPAGKRQRTEGPVTPAQSHPVKPATMSPHSLRCPLCCLL